MSYPKMVKLLEALLQKTARDEVPWEETEDEGTYQVALTDYSARVRSRLGRDSWGNPTEDFLLAIYNNEGKKIEEVSDDDLQTAMTNAYAKMKELHTSARRKALGVEGALDAILSSLEGKRGPSS